MRRSGSGHTRVRSQAYPSRGLRSLLQNREVLVVCVGLIVLVPLVLMLRARKQATMVAKGGGEATIVTGKTARSTPGGSTPLRGSSFSSQLLELDLSYPDLLICSSPPTRALLVLPDPVARAETQAQHGQDNHGLSLLKGKMATGLIKRLNDCYLELIQEGGGDMEVKRETGDRQLAKKVEECLLLDSSSSSTTPAMDEVARRAVYESIYLAKVLKLYEIFKPRDLMILRSEDLSPATAEESSSEEKDRAKQLVQEAETHLSACYYKLSLLPLKLDIEAAGSSSGSKALYEAFAPWNEKLSSLVGRPMGWAPALSGTGVAAVHVEEDGDAPLLPPPLPQEGEEKKVPPPEVKEESPQHQEVEMSEPRTVEARVRELIDSSPVMIFSKSYCPYSRAAKAAMAEAGADMVVLELDEDDEGMQIQTVLAKMTGRRTVPNVFVKGISIGGGDETRALATQGRLVPLLKEAKALKTSSRSD